MILKAVLFLLVGISVLAIFGRLRWPRLGQRSGICPDCGRPLIGKGPCECKERQG